MEGAPEKLLLTRNCIPEPSLRVAWSQKQGAGQSIGSLEPPQISVPGIDLILDQREIMMHLMPEGGLGQPAIGVDGVNLCHF